MIKKCIQQHKVFIALLVVISVAHHAHAMSLSLSTAVRMNVGDTVIVPVVLNTENTSINTIEGTIQFSDLGTVDVRDISTGGSQVPLWVRSPSLSESGNAISFVAAFPGGITRQSVPFFTIAFHARKPGQLTLSSKELVGYLNDGLGTSVVGTTHFPQITIGAAAGSPIDELQKTIASDNIPPLVFPVELHQTKELYDGKKFLVFHTTDEQSGIDFYEVSEDGGPWIRTGTEYVLMNQDHAVKVTIRAIDRAGNIRVTETRTGSRWGYRLVGIAILGLILGVLIFFRKKIKKWVMRKKYEIHHS